MTKIADENEYEVINMVGSELRTSFDMMTLDQKSKIKRLCEKYGVKPECRYPGGAIENMSFDFGDNKIGNGEFNKEMEIIMDVVNGGNKRRVFGHRIECPL